MTKERCKSCGYIGIKRFLSLGEMPPVNAFVKKEEIINEKKYPLDLAYCPVCYLVQLEKVVPPEELFRNYLHLSAGSQANIEHLKEVADYLGKKFALNSSSKVLEIGSNDGTLLNFFKKYTSHVLGVDPAKNLVELNKEKGVNYMAEFFDTQVSSKLFDESQKNDLIVALNVIPHTPDNISLLKSARMVLQDKGVLVMEGVYALETILRGEFDTIYHEHVYTFSLHSLMSLFGFAGMKIIDVEKIPTQGGSLRVYAMKNEFAPIVSESVNKILSEEKNMGLANSDIYDSVRSKVESYKIEMRKIIDVEKAKSGKLIGLGAPARGVVIMNYCGIDGNDLEFIADDTPLKHGKVSPGTHIPVVPFDAIKNYKDRTFMLLSWNYKDSFVNRISKEFSKFRMIVPFPKLEIIEHG